MSSLGALHVNTARSFRDVTFARFVDRSSVSADRPSCGRYGAEKGLIPVDHLRVPWDQSVDRPGHFWGYGRHVAKQSYGVQEVGLLYQACQRRCLPFHGQDGLSS